MKIPSPLSVTDASNQRYIRFDVVGHPQNGIGYDNAMLNVVFCLFDTAIEANVP